MKFDPRYAILAVLLILAVFKITQKERYMCGGKREGYKSASGPKPGRPRPALGAKPIKKEGYCAKCGSGGQVFGKPCPKCSGGKEGYCSSCGM
jgi:hypothetical protein